MTIVFFISIIAGLPILSAKVEMKINGRRNITLSWDLPRGFFTSQAIEVCPQQEDCRLHQVARDDTSLEVEDAAASYRLLVYQHGQLVMKSRVFEEDELTLDGMSNI